MGHRAIKIPPEDSELVKKRARDASIGLEFIEGGPDGDICITYYAGTVPVCGIITTTLVVGVCGLVGLYMFLM